MTNEEIIKEYGKPGNWISLSDLLDLARTDEREKIKNQMLDGVMTDSEFEEYTGSKRDQPQGVDIWVSWGTRGYLPYISSEKPFESNVVGGVEYTRKTGRYCERFPLDIARKIGLQPGQCRKFRIVEVVE